MKKFLQNLSLLLLLLLAITNNTIANSKCLQGISIPLDDNGIVIIDYTMITNYSSSDNIVLSKDNNNYLQELEFGCSDIGIIHNIYVKNLDNNELCISTVDFFDQKGPVPYCKTNSTTSLNNGPIILYAIDFDKESYDNCTSEESLAFIYGTYAFNFPKQTINGILINKAIAHYFDANGPISAVINASQSIIDSYNNGEIQKWDPQKKSSSRIFTTTGIESIPISVTDESGNSGYCSIQLTLSSDYLYCKEELTVNLSSNGNAMVQATTFISNLSTRNVEVSRDGIYFESEIEFNCDDVSAPTEITIRNKNTLETCTVLVKILDKIDPYAFPSDTSFDLTDASEIIQLQINDITQLSYDNCGNPEITITPNTLDVYNLGNNTITIVATDASGNSTTVYSNIYLTLNGNPYTTICHKEIELSTDPWVCFRKKIDASDLYIGNATHDSSKVSLDNINFYESIEDFPNNELNDEFTVYVETIDDGIATYCESNVKIVDKIVPVAVAIQNFVVKLTDSSTGGNGSAKIFADQIDNGSHDACSSVFVEIRRDSNNCGINGNNTFNADGHPFDGNSDPLSPDYDTDDGNYVKFCCDDITAIDQNGVPYGNAQIWLRVWDLNGNYNDIWTNIRVEHKIQPSVVCPPDIIISCDADSEDLDITGKGQGVTFCENIEVEYNDIIKNINDCGIGFIIRRWYVKGHLQISCDQRINIIDSEQFEIDINWPANIEINEPNQDTGEPTWTNLTNCAQLTYSSTSDTVQIIPNEQFTITKVWEVIDLCRYEENFPNEDPNQNGIQDGICTYEQIITVDYTQIADLVRVRTILGRPLPNVIINSSYNTNEDGNSYVNDDIISSISLADEYLNGINLLDLIHLQNHILQLNEFISDYQLISADFNQDELINSTDRIDIKNLLLGITNSNPDWKFIDKIDDISGPIKPKANYIGYKLGDVDDTSLLEGEMLPEESNSISYKDILLNNGQSYDVPFILRDQASVSGLEIRLKIDQSILEINDITANFDLDWHITPTGELTILNTNLAFNPTSMGGDESEAIFTIQFKARDNSILHQAIDPQDISSFLASDELELIVLGLNSEGEIINNVSDETIRGLSIYPNPASDYLMIDISNSKIKDNYVVCIYNTKGQLILEKSNPQTIDLTNIKSGLYLYQIKTNNQLYVNKLSIVK